MSIKVRIKDIQLNEIFEVDKINSSIETIKTSNTFVISTKKIYYFDDDDTFKLVPQLDYRKKNKVLTEYLGLPDKKESVNNDNKAKMNKFLKDKKDRISINISSLNVQNFKHISRVISGLNRLKKQNYDFICFQNVEEFTNEYRIILRQLDMNYIYENTNENKVLLIGNFSTYGKPESIRKWKEIDTYNKSGDNFSTSGTLFEINEDDSSHNSIFIINCFFKFKFGKKDTLIYGNNLENDFEEIIKFYKNKLINNNNIFFKDRDFNFIICGNFNNTKYEVIINKILKTHDILATDSCKLIDTPKCSEDTLKSKSLKKRSLINGKLKLDGFFVSNYIHVSDSRVRSDLCHNWSKYKLIELKCFLKSDNKYETFNSLYSLMNNVNFNHIYYHNLKKYSNSILNIKNYQKDKYEELVGGNLKLFPEEFVFYLDDNNTEIIEQLNEYEKILNKVKELSTLSEASKLFYVLTNEINQFKFNKDIISINYYISKYLFITYNLINFGHKEKSYYIYLDKNKHLNISIIIRSRTENIFMLENEIKLIYNTVIDILFEKSKKNKVILHLIVYIFFKMNHLNSKFDINKVFKQFNLLDIFSNYYNDFHNDSNITNNSDDTTRKQNVLKLMNKIKLKSSKLMNQLLESDKYFKKIDKIKYTQLKSIKKFVTQQEELIIKINYNSVTQDLNCDGIILNSNKKYIKNIIDEAEKQTNNNFKKLNDINVPIGGIDYPRIDLNQNNAEIDNIEKIDGNIILLMIEKLIG